MLDKLKRLLLPALVALLCACAPDVGDEDRSPAVALEDIRERTQAQRLQRPQLLKLDALHHAALEHRRHGRCAVDDRVS
jgi:hypothetical protein